MENTVHKDSLFSEIIHLELGIPSEDSQRKFLVSYPACIFLSLITFYHLIKHVNYAQTFY